VRDRSCTPLFDPGKLCGPINDIRSSTSWLHGYNTVVHDLPKNSGKLSACANSRYQALLSQAGRAWERGYVTLYNDVPLYNDVTLYKDVTYTVLAVMSIGTQSTHNPHHQC